jgi:predicted enzyme related to lactoylglutathione lyase
MRRPPRAYGARVKAPRVIASGVRRDARGDSYDFDVLRVVSVEPIFVVSDVPRAVAHYEQLGFSTSHHDVGYAFAHRNELTIHLAGPGVGQERVGRGSIYMHVDDADALAEEWRGAGIDFVEPRTLSTASVRARMRIPTETSFASVHPLGVRAVWPSGARGKRDTHRLSPRHAVLELAVVIVLVVLAMRLDNEAIVAKPLRASA